MSKEISFTCCNKEYTIESDTITEHECSICKQKYKKNKTNNKWTKE